MLALYYKALSLRSWSIEGRRCQGWWISWTALWSCRVAHPLLIHRLCHHHSMRLYSLRWRSHGSSRWSKWSSMSSWRRMRWPRRLPHCVRSTRESVPKDLKKVESVVRGTNITIKWNYLIIMNMCRFAGRLKALRNSFLDSWQLSVLPRIDARLYLTKNQKEGKPPVNLAPFSICLSHGPSVWRAAWGVQGKFPTRRFDSTIIKQISKSKMAG